MHKVKGNHEIYYNEGKNALKNAPQNETTNAPKR